MGQLQHTKLIVSIKGLADGTYTVDLSAPIESIEYMFEEFFGTLHLSGTMRKHGKRYLFDLRARSLAHLLCDISGEEYDEEIEALCSLEYIANTRLALLQADEAAPEPPLYIRDDDTSIDLTDEIRQELSVNLPLKRIAPQYRDRSLQDIFPDYAQQSGEEDNRKDDNEPDERWAALKNIRFDKHM